MPTADHDPLGPEIDGRLKDALDRITPPWTQPRYASASMGTARWRLVPVLIAVGATVLLVLTGTAATGSANPTVWTQRAASTLESIGHPADASPSPERVTIATPSRQTPKPTRGETEPTPSQRAEHESSPSPEPRESPDHSPRPGPSASPSPSGGHSESSPTPSPTPGDH